VVWLLDRAAAGAGG